MEKEKNFARDRWERVSLNTSKAVLSTAEECLEKEGGATGKRLGKKITAQKPGIKPDRTLGNGRTCTAVREPPRGQKKKNRLTGGLPIVPQNSSPGLTEGRVLGRGGGAFLSRAGNPF